MLCCYCLCGVEDAHVSRLRLLGGVAFRFVSQFSGIACSVAEMATFWIDSLKVRRQVVGELGGKPQGSLSLLKGMGVTGAYQGISAALLRQITYGSARYGIFMVRAGLLLLAVEAIVDWLCCFHSLR